MHRFVLAACGGAAAALVGCAGVETTGAGSAAAERPREFRVMPVGLCEDYPEETRSIEVARRDLEVLRRAGVRELRVSIGWDGVETSDDVFDWSFWDWYIPTATEEFGVRLLPYVCYTPAWAAAEGEGETYTRPPRDVREFEEFVAAAAARYGAWIDSWELWNEPDNRQYWTGTVEEFVELVRAGARGVRREDPGALVVLGGIAWDLEFLRRALEAGAAPAVDVVNLHSYLETWHEGPAELVRRYVAEAADVVRAYGEGETLWMAEVGYSTYRRDGGFVSEQYTARHGFEHTEAHQGAHLLKTIAMLAASGEIDLVAWYEIRDLPAGEEVIGDVNNRHLGVVRVDGSPKPALAAVAFARELFGRPFRSADEQVRVRGVGGAVGSCAFEYEDGAIVVVAWRPVTESGEVEVEVETPRRVGKVVVLDEAGAELGERVRVERAGERSVVSGVRVGTGGVRVIWIEVEGR